MIEAQDKPTQGQKIAVIGGGVAGIVTAHLLQKQHEVSLFEQNDYLGGHTHTIEITDGPDAGLAVDTGFIVLNDATYPLFRKFIAQLGVEARVSEMSFGFQCHRTGLVYAGTDLNGLFAQRRNLFSPSFYGFLLEIVRFCKQAQQDLDAGDIAQITLGGYLARGRYSSALIDNYLVPMAGAIWSTPAMQIHDFPAGPFLHFFRNHGLLALRDRPLWRTVVGGSSAYVKAFARGFSGTIHLQQAVHTIRRDPERVQLTLADGSSQNFDQVVIATHADQALRLLQDPSELEQQLLSPWQYQLNQTVLHTDASILPTRKHAWAAWNFTREAREKEDRPVYVTYYMNRLQGLRAKNDYCVTLNRGEAFKPDSVIAEMAYHHPLYSFASMATQSKLPQLNGCKHTYFCGSYFGYGFHEDAVKSGVEVAKAFGLEL